MNSEFDLIRRYFTRPVHRATLGIGDDAALIACEPGMDLAISTDTLVADRHFFANTDPGKLGHKALAVNLSDMAAMGATPRWVTLALTLPADQFIQPGWLGVHAGFCVKHLSSGADWRRYHLRPLEYRRSDHRRSWGKALRRSTALPGDDIWVSGQLGDAAMALAHLQRRIALDPVNWQPACFCSRPRRVSTRSQLIDSPKDRHFRWFARRSWAYPECSHTAATVYLGHSLLSRCKHLTTALAVDCLLAGVIMNCVLPHPRQAG